VVKWARGFENNLLIVFFGVGGNCQSYIEQEQQKYVQIRT